MPRREETKNCEKICPGIMDKQFTAMNTAVWIHEYVLPQFSIMFSDQAVVIETRIRHAHICSPVQRTHKISLKSSNSTIHAAKKFTHVSLLIPGESWLYSHNLKLGWMSAFNSGKKKATEFNWTLVGHPANSWWRKMVTILEQRCIALISLPLSFIPNRMSLQLFAILAKTYEWL